MAFTWTSNINTDYSITGESIREIQDNIDYIDDHLANIANDGSVQSGQYSSRRSSNYGYCSGQFSSALNPDCPTENSKANASARGSN